MYCKNCGNEMIDGARFCTNCGAKVETPSVDQSMPTPITFVNTQPAPPTYPALSQTSRPLSTPNPVAGFILSIIGLVHTLCAWIIVIFGGFYNNIFALIYGVIGLIFGVISLILILIYRSKYLSLHGIGIVGLVFAGLSGLFAVILIIAFIGVQSSSHNMVNNLRELERLFD
ncbi:MAG: zinc-ribbon domain-containing protein [Ruminococcus sp.]|nr:zinc-ribbon domain-containing protein [Ruminococcus sp.]